MEGTARSCSQMWVCCSSCTCCQRKSAKLVPIDKSAPPPICSSSDCQSSIPNILQTTGSPEADTVDPEPSSSAPRSALGSKKETDLEPYVIVFHEQKKKKARSGRSASSDARKKRGRVRNPQLGKLRQ